MYCILGQFVYYLDCCAVGQNKPVRPSFVARRVLSFRRSKLKIGRFLAQMGYKKNTPALL